MNSATPEQHAAARELTFATNSTQQQIADQVGVTRKTISMWSKYGRWQEMKANSLRIPAELVDDMYRELEELNNVIHSRPAGQRIPTDKEAALRHRILMSIKQIKKQQAVPEMQQTINMFIRYVEQSDTYAGRIMRNRLIGFLENTDPSGFRPYDMEYTEPKEVPDPVLMDSNPLEYPGDAPDLQASDFDVVYPPSLEEHLEKLNNKKNQIQIFENKRSLYQEYIDISDKLTQHKERNECVSLYYSDGKKAAIISDTTIKYYQSEIHYIDLKLTELRLEDQAARQEHEKHIEEFYTLHPHLRPDTAA